MKNKIIKILAQCLVAVMILALLTYFILRIRAMKDADYATDSFFAEFPTANQAFIKNHLHLINQNFTDALAIIKKHNDAIVNFDYKNTTPEINLMLNKATIPVSWHLTIHFIKKNTGWYVSKFDEYIENQN